MPAHPARHGKRVSTGAGRKAPDPVRYTSGRVTGEETRSVSIRRDLGQHDRVVCGHVR